MFRIDGNHDSSLSCQKETEKNFSSRGKHTYHYIFLYFFRFIYINLKLNCFIRGLRRQGHISIQQQQQEEEDLREKSNYSKYTLKEKERKAKERREE